MSEAAGREARVRALYRARPRERFLRASVLALAALGAYCWIVGDFALDLFTERRLDNLRRFLHELRPYPLADRPFDLGVARDWAVGLFVERGGEAATATLAIAIAAIVLAGLAGFVAALPAARNIASPEPFLAAARPPGALARFGWLGVVYGTRMALVFLRAIPEYVWAFLFIAVIGPTAWPAVLALALHNAGILGKLDGEVVENLERRTLAALRGLGATRLQIVGAAILPAALPRFLLFFFYRWETCVREATVLGMLGIVSLGFWIQDARARNQPDTMLFYVLIGAALVVGGDLVSAWARRLVRRAG